MGNAKTISKEIIDLHNQACARGEETYTDPESGALVFTRVAHLKRGYCCKSGCRHCPYGFQSGKKDLQTVE